MLRDAVEAARDISDQPRRRITREEYARYLEGSHWAILREDALVRFGYRCALCYSQEALEVHHRTYERLGDEELTDLVVLCADCHGRHHGVLGANTEMPW